MLEVAVDVVDIGVMLGAPAEWEAEVRVAYTRVLEQLEQLTQEEGGEAMMALSVLLAVQVL